jgi:hypothetical protein
MTGLAKSPDLQGDVRKCPEMSATRPIAGLTGGRGRRKIACSDGRFALPADVCGHLEHCQCVQCGPAAVGCRKRWSVGRRTSRGGGHRCGGRSGSPASTQDEPLTFGGEVAMEHRCGSAGRRMLWVAGVVTRSHTDARSAEAIPRAQAVVRDGVNK